MDFYRLLEMLAVFVPLVLIGYELSLHCQEARNQSRLRGFELYHTLAQQYAGLLYRADLNPELNATWEPFDEERRKELDAAQDARDWGAWYAMTPTERRCYRWTRAVLETFEQAYQVRQQGWINDDTWAKWQGWMAIWQKSRYFDYVFEDTLPRLIPGFAASFSELLDGAQDVKVASARKEVLQARKRLGKERTQRAGADEESE